MRPPAGTPTRAVQTFERRRTFRLPFSDVPGPFGYQPLDTALDGRPGEQQVRGMRAFWWDGFWASVPDTILLSYLGLFIVALGGSNGAVGLVTAAGSLFAALAFLPGAWTTERFRHRKLTVLLTGGGVARLALVGLAIVPLMTDGDTAIWIVLALVSIRGFFGYFAIPAWTSLTADIVPASMRGRFLASRNFGMTLPALLSGIAAGLVLDQYSNLHGWTIVWSIAALTALLSTLAYSRIPEPSGSTAVQAEQRPGFVREMLADGNFLWYLVGTAVWGIALHAAGPFFTVYMAEELDASATWIGFLVALPSITGLAGLIYFGRQMDLRGTRWVLLINGFLIPLLPAAWLVVDAPWQIILINAPGGVFWAGYQLAVLNLTLVISTPEQRPRYAAAYHGVAFAAAFAGPLLGGALIELAGYKLVFALSAVGRLAGTLIMARFVRVRPAV